MRYQNDINTEHNMKSIFRAAVAQWTKHLTRNGQTRVRIREALIFDITDIVCLWIYSYVQSTSTRTSKLTIHYTSTVGVGYYSA